MSWIGVLCELQRDWAHEATTADSSGDMIREVAVAGAGIGNLPTFIIADAVANGRLEVVLGGHEREPVAMYAVLPATQHVPTRLRAFIDFLVEEFGESRPGIRPSQRER